MIDKTTIDKILDTAEIVDVISDFVSLKRRGANFIACCPFHDEKTPSFSVSPSKGIFKCFGCGKAGNAIAFIMEHEHMSYIEAIKYLGKKYGIEVREKEESEEDAAQRLRNESLLAATEYAAKFYRNILLNTNIGQNVGLTYFKQRRQFSDEMISRFGLGYSTDTISFSEKALKEGYKKEYLTESGLSIERDNGTLTDKFYDRVMFPIYSLSGRVIAFGGRTLKTDKSIAKYVNSPESEIYHKSKSLYGIFQAKSAIVKNKKCYLVEGYADVISFHQSGIENVVASSGTSLTSEQIKLIKRFTQSVTVLYDGDAAGIKASIRGIDMLLEEGLEVKVVLLPEGEDPDSFAMSHSLSEIESYLKQFETDFIDFKYELLSNEIDRDPIKKGELIREVIHSISVIPDQITRQIYIERCVIKLGISEEILVQEVAKGRRKLLETNEKERVRTLERDDRRREARGEETLNEESLLPKNGITVPILEGVEKDIIYYMVKFGETPLFEGVTVAQYIATQLTNDELQIQNPLHKMIYDEYFKINAQEGENQEAIQRTLINSRNQNISKGVLDIIVQEHKINVKQFLESLIPEENILTVCVPKTVTLFKAKITEYTYQLLMKQLETAQKEENKELQVELLNQMKLLMMVKNQFSKELNRL